MKLETCIAVYCNFDENDRNKYHLYRIIKNAAGLTLGERLKSAVNYCEKNQPNWFPKDVNFIASPFNIVDLECKHSEASLLCNNS